MIHIIMSQKIVLERNSGSCEKLRTKKFLAKNLLLEQKKLFFDELKLINNYFVNISILPSYPIATVCSKWADKDLSRVIKV